MGNALMKIRLTVTLPEELAEALEAERLRQNRSMSNMIETGLRWYLRAIKREVQGETR